MATKRIINKLELSATTTDGSTAQILGTFVMPTDSAVCAIIDIVGRSSTGETVTAKMSTGVKNVSGVATIIGTVTTLIGLTGDLGIVTSVISFDISGTSLRAKVTGVISKNIEWWGEMKLIVN